MPRRPAVKSSYLTKNRFQRHFFSSSQLNQLLQAAFFFLPFFSYLLTKNMHWILRRRREEPRFNGGSLIAWIAGCGRASRAVAMLSTSDTNIHVRYMCSPLWWAAIGRWTTCSLQCPYLGIWPAIFAPVPTYELRQPSPFFPFHRANTANSKRSH